MLRSDHQEVSQSQNTCCVDRNYDKHSIHINQLARKLFAYQHQSHMILNHNQIHNRNHSEDDVLDDVEVAWKMNRNSIQVRHVLLDESQRLVSTSNLKPSSDLVLPRECGAAEAHHFLVLDDDG